MEHTDSFQCLFLQSIKTTGVKEIKTVIRNYDLQIRFIPKN